MKRKRPIHKGYLEPSDVIPPIEENQLRLERLFLEDITLSHHKNIRMVCDTIHFKRCTIDENILQHAEFIDCIFEDTIFTNNRFTHSTFVRCEFHRTKLDGTHIIESMIEHTKLDNCNATYLDLANNSINVFEVQDTTLVESSWFENKMSQVTFDRVNLSKSDLYQTSLADIDLSTSIIEGMKTDARGIKGAIISEQQAVLLCSLFGVIVKNESIS